MISLHPLLWHIIILFIMRTTQAHATFKASLHLIHLVEYLSHCLQYTGASM